MGQSRKIRYQSKGNPFPPLEATGAVWLKYEEEGEAQEHPQKGDMRMFLNDDATNKERVEADYYSLGHAGYLKAEIYDGKKWCLVVMDGLLPDKINHFSKKEQPAATYLVCKDEMEALGGRKFERIYREHYELLEEDD